MKRTGALVKGYNHEWLHSLPEEQKEAVNEAIREYKFRVMQMKLTENGLDGRPIEIKIDMSDCIEIPLEDNVQHKEKKQKFDRAKEKQKLKREIQESLEDDEYYR